MAECCSRTLHTYGRKRALVEAIQWTGENICELHEFCGDNLYYLFNYGVTTVKIKTIIGEQPVVVGDYIVKGLRGTSSKLYIAKPNWFEAVYEIVEG